MNYFTEVERNFLYLDLRAGGGGTGCLGVTNNNHTVRTRKVNRLSSPLLLVRSFSNAGQFPSRLPVASAGSKRPGPFNRCRGSVPQTPRPHHRVRASAIWLLTAFSLVAFASVGEAGQPVLEGDPGPRGVRGEPVNHGPLIELGRALFFDARLSRDGTVGCTTCHQPEKAFADGKKVAEGIQGKKGTRNAPSLRNAGYAKAQFWDGRRPSLEAQVLDPFINPVEHGLRDHDALLVKLRQSADYEPLCEKVLGKSVKRIELGEIASALSAYVLTLKETDTRLDRYLFAPDTSALSPAEQRGLGLFRGRAQCATCHALGETEAPLTDGRYHSLAVGFDRLAPKLASLTKRVAKTPREEVDRLISSDADLAALGRFVVTRSPPDHSTKISGITTTV